jgi:hypothetical protein
MSLYYLSKAYITNNYMTFSISALVLARDSHIKPDSEAGGLVWVEGWYQGRYGKFHVIIFLSHILHWPFPSIDIYIAKKIFELTNCENKSLRELPLFNQSRKLAPDRRTESDKFPGGPVVFINSPYRLSGKLVCQPLPLRIDKSRFSVNST